MVLAIALLAAGSSRRMRGRDKLLEAIDGVPLLRRQAERALAAGQGPLAVTLPPGDRARTAVLEGLPLTRLHVPDAQEGLAASLRTAARWAQGLGTGGLMICPADLPDLTAEDFGTIGAAFVPDGAPLRATSEDGRPGHPVVFPARLLDNFAALTGDEGARALLRGHPPRPVALPGSRATADLDTPEDWSEWRRAQKRGRADCD